MRRSQRRGVVGRAPRLGVYHAWPVQQLDGHRRLAPLAQEDAPKGTLHHRAPLSVKPNPPARALHHVQAYIYTNPQPQAERKVTIS